MGVPEGFFGAALGPAIVDACRGCLSDLHWFRTDWQRGGALTGYAAWNNCEHRCPVVVKLPVPPRELFWLKRLQPEHHAHGDVVPLLLSHGREMGGYDLAWVVMRKMAYGPLNGVWGEAELPLMGDVAARFYCAAKLYPIDEPPRDEPWEQTVKRSRQVMHDLPLPESQRWSHALKDLQKHLPKILEFWRSRPIEDWCHGDLHMANAMTDAEPPGGPAVLFDLAMVHAGHWVEDAVYLESLYWPNTYRFNGADVVKAIAAARKNSGLKGESDWPRLANIRRALVAAAVPAQQALRPDPAQLHAALGVLEKMNTYF